MYHSIVSLFNEMKLQSHLNLIKDLKEEIARSQKPPDEGNTCTLVTSFDSLTEEFQLLKECMIPQDVSQTIAETTQSQVRK